MSWIKTSILIIIYSGILLDNCSSQECPSAKADIVFVVDDSSSVQRSNFKIVLAFIQDIVRTLAIGTDAAQVGFVSFSNTVKNQFYFNDYTEKAGLIDKIGKIIFRTGGTDIAKALNEAFQSHFQNPSGGGRDDASKVLVLITDGTSRGTEEISRTIRNAGIDILCVGITSGVDLQQLADISGDRSKVFDASAGFSRLETITGMLSSKTCDAIQPEVNPCDSGPCQHSGTCVNHGGGEYSCLCTRQYVGKLCEMKVDKCDPNPCLHGGSCSSTFYSFTCQCTPKFMGAICDLEVPVKPCEPNPCLNSGVCEESGEDFICHCLPDYTGKTCESEITACIPNPCVHNAVCYEDEGRHTPVCLCKEGFGDINCETGGLIPIVAEIGGDTDVSCINSQNISMQDIEIVGTELKRQERKTNKVVRLKNVGETDIHSTLLCHYSSQSTNTTTSMNLPLIVVEKKTEKSETATKFTCAVFTVFKNVNITIEVSNLKYRLKDDQTTANLTLGESELSSNKEVTGDPSYTVSEPEEMISKYVVVDDQHADVRCSVTYNNKEIWSGLLSEKKEVPPKIKETEGFPVWAWILLGIVIGGVITVIIVYNVCKSCRRGAAGKRKSRSKSEDKEEGEEFKALGKKQDFNNIEIENDNEANDSKVPLKSDT